MRLWIMFERERKARSRDTIYLDVFDVGRLICKEISIST